MSTSDTIRTLLEFLAIIHSCNGNGERETIY